MPARFARFTPVFAMQVRRTGAARESAYGARNPLLSSPVPNGWDGPYGQLSPSLTRSFLEDPTPTTHGFAQNGRSPRPRAPFRGTAVLVSEAMSGRLSY